MAKVKQKTAKIKANQEGIYFLKLTMYLLLGSLWIKITSGTELQIPVPIGLLVGLAFVKHEHFQIDRKIDYAILLIAALIGFWLPFGVNGALRFLEEDASALDLNVGVVCYPCLNPRGYILNSRWVGENPHSRVDLNRNFKDGSEIEEVKIFTESLSLERSRFHAAVDLHETLPEDGVVMALQYPDREFDPYEKTPDAFYMWEICADSG